MLPTKIVLVASFIAIAARSAPAEPLDRDIEIETGVWRVVVDGVMGGRSTGGVAQRESGIVEFSGDLSLENNGGFSQMRRDVNGNRFSGARGIEIIVRGDGREYNFDVRCSNARVFAGAFQCAFDTENGQWTTIRMPFDDFRLHSFGQPVPGAPEIEPEMIESIGVTLSDKKAGPFLLKVASIRAFGEKRDAGRAASPELSSVSRESTLALLRSLGDSDNRQRRAKTPSPTPRSKAVRIAEIAISRGAPLYNDGHAAACAAVYEVTIESLVALGSDDLESSVIERLQVGLAEGKAEPRPSERAWTYRRALDDAFLQLSAQSNHTEGLGTP